VPTYHQQAREKGDPPEPGSKSYSLGGKGNLVLVERDTKENNRGKKRSRTLGRWRAGKNRGGQFGTFLLV